VDKCLVEWMLNLMMERRVHMVVDGQEGQEQSVPTGLRQGSPTSPIVFVIYMHDLHQYIECRFQGITSFSFVDDFTWLDKQRSFSAIAQRMLYSSNGQNRRQFFCRGVLAHDGRHGIMTSANHDLLISLPNVAVFASTHLA
jgi:hypothetical protein